MWLRVRAMWYHSRLIITISTLLFLLNVLSYIIIISYMQATAVIGPALPPFTGCSFQPTFRHAYITFIMSILFETFVIFVTVIKSWPILRHRRFKLPMYSLLLKDGLVYYISICSMHAVIVIAGFFADFITAVEVITSIPALAVTGIACNRMFLRLQATLLGRGTFSFSSRALDTSIPPRRWAATGAEITIANNDHWTVESRQGPGSTHWSDIGMTDLDGKSI
ncbi:hypothetical protein CPB86DRAFT_248949 [Serendipita vermifera]|nr:hypothetical protein CPB86DRAFT_248949 [Serendipita vermifera]